MSELTLRFGEARLHVEGDADLVERERAAFLEYLGRLDRQSEKAGELLAVLLRAGHAPEKAEEPVSKKAEPEEPAAEVFMFREDVPLSAELQEVLWDACQEHEVEYALALGLIETESSFNPEAVSYVGCYGLMQLNPDYFPADLSPAENIQYGVALIAEKLDQYAGNVGAALTAYNAGHDTGNREYAEKVMAAAERWRTE